MAIEDIFDPYDVFVVIVPGSLFISIPFLLTYFTRLNIITIGDLTPSLVVILIFLSYIAGMVIVAIASTAQNVSSMPSYSYIFLRAFISDRELDKLRKEKGIKLEELREDERLDLVKQHLSSDHDYLEKVRKHIHFPESGGPTAGFLAEKFSKEFSSKYTINRNCIEPSDIETIYHIVESEIESNEMSSLQRVGQNTMFFWHMVFSTQLYVYFLLFLFGYRIHTYVQQAEPTVELWVVFLVVFIYLIAIIYLSISMLSNERWLMAAVFGPGYLIAGIVTFYLWGSIWFVALFVFILLHSLAELIRGTFTIAYQNAKQKRDIHYMSYLYGKFKKERTSDR